MPVNKYLILCFLPLVPLCVHAEKGQSIMFESGENSITTPPELSADQSHGDKCQTLMRKIESLKGKPQRKHTAMERYRKECSSQP
ncbi:MAG: hypothetical protein KZQ93_01365 [Candidatus Thiodiazotropha sp. (ex Monitilora ramsayi)]|nr:hypothetical protein [Candidatus Thiodiazotropha sp. (ex Monitilora ramsayi)]